MRVEMESAWIIHRRPYRETSLLVDVLSLGHGRVGLVARGARRPSRTRNVRIEPFQALRVSWAGHGELMNLQRAEADGGPSLLRGRRLWSGLYVNELLMRLVPRHDPCPDIFHLYSQLMDELADTGDEQGLLRGFELQLLHCLGYGLVLDADPASGEPVQVDGRYDYLVESGPLARSTGVPRPDAIPVSGAVLLALAGGNPGSEMIKRDCKIFMRSVLRHYLGEQPLNSIRLFHSTRVTSSA